MYLGRINININYFVQELLYYYHLLKTSKIKCSDLLELCPELVESNVVTWHLRKASDNAVKKVNSHKGKTTMSHHHLSLKLN